MPPWQPWSFLSQLTMSSGESTGDGEFLAMANRSLNTSEAEKAQQLPHCCWSRMGWIKLSHCLRESKSEGRLLFARS